MASKRILFYCGGSAVAGVEILTLAMMKELLARGHAVHCLVSGWNDGDFVARLKGAGIGFDILKLGFVHLRKPLWTVDTLLHYPGAVRGWRRVVEWFRPDVGWHVSPRTVLMLHPFLVPGRTVLHVHDRDHPSRRRRFLYRLLDGRVVRFVAVSRFIGEHLAALGVSAGKISVILNGVAGAGGGSPDLRDGQGQPVRIGIVGQIIERKGHQDLIEALRVLRGRGFQFQCLVFGKGDPVLQGRLRRQATAAGLDGSVHWKGFVAAPERIYSQLDIVVAPTRDQEPFGLAALEPALWELPVVASRSGGLMEVVRDGETGLLCKPGDPLDLADNLARLLVDPALRRTLGTTARRRAIRDFSLSRMIDQMEELLDSLERPCGGR